MTMFVLMLVTAALLLGGAVWAGGQDDGSGAASGAVQWADGETLPISFANLSSDLALPITAERYDELRVAFQTKHQNRPMDQYASLMKIAENTNIYPIYETLDRGKWPEYEPSIFASGTDLPDLVEVHSANLRWSYAQAGYILPLEPLMQHAPDLKHLFDMRPVERKLATYPDGKLYSIPRMDDNRGMVFFLSINEKHLNALNADIPQSYDEFVKLAKLIVSSDPDGDGKVNQNVMRMQQGGATLTRVMSIFYGFNSGDPWILQDGKMKLSAATDQWKDLITEMKRWYDEGLVNNLAFDDLEAFKAAGAVNSMEHTWVSGGENTVYLPLFPDVYGNMTTARRGNSYVPERSWTITKDAKDPVIAIKWLNYVTAHEEGNGLWQHGVEGIDWKYDDKLGVIRPWADPEADWVKATEEERTANGRQSYGDQRRAGASFTDQSTYNMNTSPWAIENYAAFGPTAKLWWNFPLLSEEEQTIADDWQVPATYIDEMMVKFVNGTEPLANWDQYITQLKKFGLDSWEKAHQMVYERMLTF